MNIIKVEKYGTLERIAELREKKKMSQKTLAKESGITERSISRWKDGAIIRRSNLERIAEALDCDVEFLECKQDYPRISESGKRIVLSPVSIIDRYLPKICDLMKNTAQRFEYRIEIDGKSPKMIVGSYIEGDTRYEYETIAPDYSGEIRYVISINGGDPIKKTEKEIEDFINGIMKFISFQVEQMK